MDRHRGRLGMLGPGGVRMTLPLSVFRHLFASVAEEMGEALRLSSVSPNVKERLDFSCALLDG